MMAPNERLCAGQPGASASGDLGYNEPQDSSNGTDATAILNQLLEMPVLWDMISDSSFTSSMPSSFEPGIDAGSTFANQDMNLNQNFGSYTQDFSHYSDLQFNMLVNEIQTPQSEGRDSPSGMVQVKTEDELWGPNRQIREMHLHTLSVHLKKIHFGTLVNMRICSLAEG